MPESRSVQQAACVITHRPHFRVRTWMSTHTPWLLAAAFAISAPLAAQERSGTVVYPGARVLAQAPVMGPAWLPGQLASARVRGLTCLGVALDARERGGAPVFVLLKGITGLKVDRRTNTDVRSTIALAPAADSDWSTVDLAALHQQDAACTVPPPPAAH